MIIYIPIKENSQRVPNKNFREFRGKPLWEHTVDKFKGSDYKVFIDTDSDDIIEKCKIKKLQRINDLSIFVVIRPLL